MASKLFRRILVPHDFSDAAAGALKEAVALAASHGGRLLVQHVITPFYLPADPRFGMGADRIPSAASFVPELTQRLDALVKKAVGATRTKYGVRVVVGDPAACILEAAGEVDSIVMATHGRSGMSHLLLGSVAEKVVRHAPVPVLTVRVARKATRARRGRKPRKAA